MMTIRSVSDMSPPRKVSLNFEKSSEKKTIKLVLKKNPPMRTKSVAKKGMQPVSDVVEASGSKKRSVPSKDEAIKTKKTRLSKNVKEVRIEGFFSTCF